MQTAFNHIANNYDETFTNTKVGIAQRNVVWKNLQNLLTERNNISILELNCGTGEDAKWMAQFNTKILATDISNEMIKVATEKSKNFNNINFAVADVCNLPTDIQQQKFDVIFSNFGGLNCLSKTQLQNLIPQLANMLNENGKIVLVIMPKFCLWESAYFLLKLQWRKAFRRCTNKPQAAHLTPDIVVNTWYHAPSFFTKKAFRNLTIAALKPVGFFVPPSYLNNIAQKHPFLFKILIALEAKATHCSWLSYMSDHYYIELTKASE